MGYFPLGDNSEVAGSRSPNRGTDVRAVGRPETKRNHNQKGIPASGTGDLRFICSFGLTLGSDKDERGGDG
jgi:hypothetical protein